MEFEEKRILHLANDDKFIDQAFCSFERICPGKNDVFIYGKSPLKYVKLIPKKIVGSLELISPLFVRELNRYRYVVIHSLDHRWVRHIKNSSPNLRIIWIGWGSDYYDLLSEVSSGILLEKTGFFSRDLQEKISIFVRLKSWLSSSLYSKDKIGAIKKISFFSPVLSSEYDAVKSVVGGSKFPKYIPWNYGTVEDDLLRGFLDTEVSGEDILVGNSSTATNNHVEIIDFLKGVDLTGRKCVFPLSYGESEYRRAISEMGHSQLGDNFEALNRFMSIDEYVGILRSCGFVIMNHVRQQALGNIVIMLYLGSKVFVREENPIYNFVRENGGILFSVQELVKNPAFLLEPLSAGERAINRSFVLDHWSREVSDKRTQVLVEKLIASEE